MPLFKVSVESVVPVSAVVFSTAVLKEDAIAEVRLLQSRARVNWRRANTLIGAIDAPYDIWALPAPGGWNVSLSAKITVSATQSVIAEDSVVVADTVVERQSQGLIKWLYRGVPIGEFKEPVPTSWSNQQPDEVTATTFNVNPLFGYPGESVILTADVTAVDTPVGSLEFRDTSPGGLGTIVSTVLEADPVVQGLAHATSVVTFPAEGSFVLGAFYLGSDGFQSSSSPTTGFMVQRVQTSSFLIPPPPPVYAGQQVSLIADIVQLQLDPPPPVQPALPSGVVTLFAGSTLVTSTNLSNVHTGGLYPGQETLASFSIGSFVPGTYNFTVVYGGDAVNQPSTSDIVPLTVLKVPTIANVTVLLAASDEPIISAVFSQPVRIRATVNGLVSGTIPTGVVEFWDGATFLGTANLTPLQFTAQADFPYNGFAIGTHSNIHVVYLGNDSFDGFFSSPWSMNITKAQAVTNASSLNSPTKFGQAANFDATVGVLPPATLTPFQTYGVAGSVFYTDVTVAPVNFNGSGHALRSVSTLPLGTSSVIVSYPTGPEYIGADTVFQHTVVKADTQATVGISPTPISWFTNVTVTSTVTAVAPGSDAPTAISGTVNFSVVDDFFGDFFLGSASVISHVASLFVPYYTYQIYAFYFGITLTGTIKATYTGDTRFNASVSAPLAYQVFPY